MTENIEQKIKAYARSICPKCVHWDVCRAAENQPCVECSCYLPAADVMVRPRWISVTERFPQPYEDVNLQFSTNQAVGFWDGYCWGVYSGDGFYTEVADNEGKPTHWCKKLPEPPKEEDNG